MNGRLADALLYLSNEDFLNEKIFSHLSREDIAGFAGFSVESTVRLLKEFKNDKIIDTDGKEIKILNLHLLKDISRRG